jgi:hypothetical protein
MVETKGRTGHPLIILIAAIATAMLVLLGLVVITWIWEDSQRKHLENQLLRVYMEEYQVIQKLNLIPVPEKKNERPKKTRP